MLLRECPADPVEEAVEVLLRALCSGDSRDPELLLLYESLVAASRDDELRAEIAASVAQLRQWQCDWFTERGVSRPLPAAVTITAAMDGFLLQRMLDPELDPAPLVEGLVALVGHHLA
ncbi:hypothetical protein ACIQOW_31260 [Kitasatospora sp. NPDC091335]|uniref:hypothetical protein n=1 Tax=Kitasatospora sp. NPDC091335 TaxID=3364085 RepID=UPI00382A918C